MSKISFHLSYCAEVTLLHVQHIHNSVSVRKDKGLIPMKSPFDHHNIYLNQGTVLLSCSNNLCNTFKTRETVWESVSYTGCREVKGQVQVKAQQP